MAESRQEMAEFWEAHSQKQTLEEMMLDTQAQTLNQKELPEIMSLLPDVTQRDVLELGAGIGRYTGLLADKARRIIAVDFMEKFLDANKKTNGHFPNAEFLQADVTKLDFQPNRFDLIFSNWLLMYLTDEEIQALGRNILSWLKEDGCLFFRESCFHQSGDTQRSSNPTHYRTPAKYMALFETALLKQEGNGAFGFEVIYTKPVQTYVKLKKNTSQLCWLLRKVRVSETVAHGYNTFHEFLDKQQYSRNSILRYEKIFGRHFISTGGRETTEEYVKMLHLKPGQSVLDVGSGIGGGAFFMAQNYDVHVIGIDLSFNMTTIAWERGNELKDNRVQFEISDATRRQFPSGSFDVVYSRDTLLHISDKKSLFKSFLRWLKPGGKLLITDYCCSEGQHSPEFNKYVEQRGYSLLSPAQYGKLFEEAGFINVKAEDKTDTFVEMLNKELTRAKSIKDEFIQEFSMEDYKAIIDGWEDKLVRSRQGDQRWGLFYAEKSPKEKSEIITSLSH